MPSELEVNPTAVVTPQLPAAAITNHLVLTSAMGDYDGQQ
jgi:hypothetical protein